MTNKSIFEFRDYKAYLKYSESQLPNRGRGFRADLARAARCQTAYVSQVLNGKAQFSLEQSQSIARFLAHNKEEARFFLLLVEYSRAGTPELKTHFLELMDEQIQKQLNLKDRFQIQETLSHEEQARYYSEWAYAAVHMATTVPLLPTADSIAEFLQLPKQKVQRVLNFLLSAGLVKQGTKGKFQAGTVRMHLGNDSSLILKHHSNWRLQAMNSLDRETERDLHFTSVVSLSLEDVLLIKARLIKEIDAYNAIIKPSQEQTLSCLTLDFFSLDKK